MTPRQPKRNVARTKSRGGPDSPSDDPESSDVSALRKLAQELQIHQVELEMQNQTLREAQRELEVSRDRYVNLFDFAPVGYATLDEHGRILSANLTLATMLQMERSQFEGRSFASLASGESRNLFRQLFAQCGSVMVKQEGDAVLHTRDGRNVYVQVIIEPLREEHGAERFLTAVVDVTEQVLARRASREGQERLNEALEASKMIAWSHDLGAGTITASANASRLLGIPEGRVYRIHKEMLEDIAGDDRKSYEQALASAVKSRGSYVVQFRFLAPTTGTLRWFEEHGWVISDDSGKACQARGVLFEITERKKAEEAMLLNYQRLVAYVTDTADAVALVDGQGGVTCISKAGAGLLGYLPDELAGINALSLAHPNDAQIAQAQLTAMRENARGSGIMIRLRSKDGSWSWFDLRASPVMRGGNENGFVVTLSAVDLYEERRPKG